MTVNDANVESLYFEAVLHRSDRCLDVIKRAYRELQISRQERKEGADKAGKFYILNNGHSVWSPGPQPVDSIEEYEPDFSILVAHYLNKYIHK